MAINKINTHIYVNQSISFCCAVFWSRSMTFQRQKIAEKPSQISYIRTPPAPWQIPLTTLHHVIQRTCKSDFSGFDCNLDPLVLEVMSAWSQNPRKYTISGHRLLLTNESVPPCLFEMNFFHASISLLKIIYWASGITNLIKNNSSTACCPIILWG